MNIPQEELDKLNDVSIDDIFPKDTEEVEKEDVQPEQVEKEEVSVSPEEDAVADEARVPYSRFETVHERAVKAEERARLLEEQLKSRQTPEKEDTKDMPQEWVELYGDSDASRRAYQLQLKRDEEREERLRQEIIESIEAREREEEEMVDRNVKALDDSLNQLASKLGRKLTDQEEAAILDIQDEFTQKDEDGNYLANLLPPDKAFEIYSLRQEKATASRKQAKQRVVSITGANTEADTDTSNDTDFNPRAWGSWRSKI